MTIVLIDISGIAHAMWHVESANPDPNAVSTATIAKVRALASGQPHVAICTEGGRSFRRDLDPSYKATRPERNEPLLHQLQLAIETLQAEGFPVWSHPTYEADDVIASAVHLARVAAQSDVLICSADKDLLQLVSDRVTVKSTASGNLYDAQAIREKYGIEPSQLIDFLALKGDSADNIKGCKGVGDKRAAELLQKYGTLEDLYAALTAHGTEFTPALATALREFEPRMATVRELIRLRTDAPVPFGEVLRERRADEDTAVFGEDDEQMGDSEAASDPGGPSTDGGAPTRPPIAVEGVTAEEIETARRKEAEKRAEQQRQVNRENSARAEAIAPTPALATVPDVLAPPPLEWTRQLEPRSLVEASRLADAMFKSRLFSAYGTPQGVFSTILAGRELGLQAMAALRAFHIIEGKPTLSADLIRALVLRSPHCQYFRCIERTNERATFVTKRGDDPEISLTVSVEDGRRAFVGDDRKFAASGWGKNPADLCVARASAKLARLVYPDIVHGLYAPSELSNEPE